MPYSNGLKHYGGNRKKDHAWSSGVCQSYSKAKPILDARHTYFLECQKNLNAVRKPKPDLHPSYAENFTDIAEKGYVQIDPRPKNNVEFVGSNMDF